MLKEIAKEVANKAAQDTDPNNRNKKVKFKNCAPFIRIYLFICISRINNTQVDNAHDIDVVMSMYNLLE